jgi:RNA polymerase sigma-70 factor (ECF subfamily)
MTDPSSGLKKSGSRFTAEAFRHYAADLHRFLRKRLRDPQKADDVVQEVFSRLVRVQHLELVRKPHSYLFGIAFHVIREMRLQEEQEPVSYDSAAVDDAAEHPAHVTPDELADRLNVNAQVERALARLPAIHRALVLMCKRDGMTYEEAAAATGVSVHMVEKYLVQARAKLLGMMWDL